MNPIFKGLAGAGVVLNGMGAVLNGFAASATGSSGLAFLCGVNLMFFILLVYCFPWDA